MGERLLCKQEVIGSIPFTSTTGAAARRRLPRSEKQRSRPGRGLALRRVLIEG